MSWWYFRSKPMRRIRPETVALFCKCKCNSYINLLFLFIYQVFRSEMKRIYFEIAYKTCLQRNRYMHAACNCLTFFQFQKDMKKSTFSCFWTKIQRALHISLHHFIEYFFLVWILKFYHPTVSCSVPKCWISQLLLW